MRGNLTLCFSLLSVLGGRQPAERPLLMLPDKCQAIFGSRHVVRQLSSHIFPPGPPLSQGYCSILRMRPRMHSIAGTQHSLLTWGKLTFLQAIPLLVFYSLPSGPDQILLLPSDGLRWSPNTVHRFPNRALDSVCLSKISFCIPGLGYAPAALNWLGQGICRQAPVFVICMGNGMQIF